MPNKDFWKDKKVLITGHQGFIGSWLGGTLIGTKARLFGMDIKNNDLYRYFDLIAPYPLDIRDSSRVEARIKDYRYDIIFHLAAQPIVGKGEYDIHETFDTNVTGTLNLLKAVETHSKDTVFVHMSTDKVYAPWVMPKTGFTENSLLGADSPYACSKVCAEDVVGMYRERGIRTVTVRAGNAFGGGDFGANRLVPDTIKSIEYGYPLQMRNADGSRPYQYVMNIVYALITLAEARYERELSKPAYNVGVDTSVDNYVLANKIADAYGAKLHWKPVVSPYNETTNLFLDCTAYNKEFGKLPFSLDYGVEQTVKVYQDMYKNPGGKLLDHSIFNGVWE